MLLCLYDVVYPRFQETIIAHLFCTEKYAEQKKVNGGIKRKNARNLSTFGQKKITSLFQALQPTLGHDVLLQTRHLE